MTIDTLRLTAAEAMGLVERGEGSGAELPRAYLAALVASGLVPAATVVRILSRHGHGI